MRGILLRSIGVVAALFMMSATHAATVLWTLDNVTFDDTGTASGFFQFDADTTTYSNIAITTTAGTTLSGETYGLVVGGGSDTLLRTAPDGSILLELFFAASLTNAGGTVVIDTIGSCGATSCEQTFGGSRLVDGGSVIGTVVPIPAAVWLFGSALGLLGWMRRKTA